MSLKATQKKTAGWKGIYLGLITIACFLVVAPQLAAQQNLDAQQQNKQGQQSRELTQVKQQAKEYAQKLKEIQKSAMENNPDLKKKRNEYQELQKKKMKNKVSENATRTEKMKAQMELRQDKELQQKRKDLQQDFLEAMKNENPNTQKYLDKLTEARRKIQKMNQQGYQGQGQNKMEK